MIQKKKAIFFSTDALIALIIMFLTVLTVYPLLQYSKKDSYIQQDVVKVLSSLKVSEINDPYVTDLISSGKISDPNKSLLEQIGEFYVTNRSIAMNLSRTILNYLNTSENIGIWYGDTLLASKNSTPFDAATNIEVERQMIGGIKGLNDTDTVTGFSARAFLSSSSPIEYFYFGGYTGDGNISINVNNEGNISRVDLEIVANVNFTICVNGFCSGHFQPADSQFEPKRFNDIDLDLHTGVNTIRFVPKEATDRLYIAGGHLKVIYNDSQPYESATRYYFPGIRGIINLYDGFYIPGTLTALNIFLDINSSKTTFLTIGDTIVYNGTPGEQQMTIPNSLLSNLLNYPELSEENVPIRLGIENISYIPVHNAYVVSVADLSGGTSSAKADCDENGIIGENTDEKGVNAVKCANRKLMNLLLDVEIVQLGLVGVDTNVDPENYHNLSTNKTSLNNTINTWSQEANLDLCYGIENATTLLNSVASGNDLKSIVLLGTRKPNACLGGPASSAITETYNLACDAWINYNIRIDTIGIIDGVEDQELDTLLRDIAACANGTYYNMSADEDLVDLYKDLAEDLLSIIFYMQTATSSPGFYSHLNPTSYIEFNYTKVSSPYGLITTLEQQFYDDYSGTFSIPPGGQIVGASVISYSGPRWTDYVKINGTTVYNITEYGSDYTKLGDPYVFQIPVSLIQQNNTITVTTGVSPANSSEGSIHNKIIYLIKQNVSSYSDVVTYAKGCHWHLEFSDNTAIDIDVPENYAETDECYFNSTNPPGQDCGGRLCTDTDHPYADAIQIAVYELLNLLDFNKDGKIDVKFTEQDLQIASSEITGIPYTFSTEMQVRVWT